MVVAGFITSGTTSMENRCEVLFKELQNIWAEIGESVEAKDRMLTEIERECVQVYQRKVDEACNNRANLLQSVAAKEAELAAIMVTLGEHTLYQQAEKRQRSLKEQLASVVPLLEDMKAEKEERMKQFFDVRSQIQKIAAEISADSNLDGSSTNANAEEENDLSLRKLNDCQAQLRALEKEKSNRLQRVLEHVNEVHSLCRVLGEDFTKTLGEVHPSLPETGSATSTNISDNTINGLARAIEKLTAEKKVRSKQLQEAAESLVELWRLMGTSEEERRPFRRIVSICSFGGQDITYEGVLTLEAVREAEAEVERLTKLKASRMKELVVKKRAELEEVCRRVHIEPDVSTSPEKTNALIDSGLVDPAELLSKIEEQITKAREQSIQRKELLDKISKWLDVCEEEKWLEGYNQDENKYSTARGGHLNLKRAEKARLIVNKIPAIVDNLISRTFAWEDERNMPFLYDGVRLISILEEYKLTRQKREEENRRYRDLKKMQSLLLKEKQAFSAPRPSPKRINSYNRKTNGYTTPSSKGFMTPTPRRISVGSATPELLSPRSYSGRLNNNYFKDMRRLSTMPLTFSAAYKEDSSSSFASISGSEPESPLPF